MEVDYVPLWLPVDEHTANDQAGVRPPDRVEGWTWPTIAMTLVAGSRSKVITRGGAVVAVLALVLALPSLGSDGLFDLPRIAIWQAVMVVALLTATRQVRSVSVATVAAFWLAGMFGSVLLAELVDGVVGAIPGIGQAATEWYRPIVAELAKFAPLTIAVVVGRKAWRHPGLSDLIVLGFAVGAGFAFHEDALWSHSLAAGFDPAGHSVWTALIGFAAGLVLLHGDEEIVVAFAVSIVLLVIGDQTVLDLRWLPVVFFIAIVAVAVSLDGRRLREVGGRDHLFPAPSAHRFDLLVGRYRRLRNGVHASVAVTGEVWPPLRGAPIAELARAARAAEVPTGADSSRLGWDRNPDDRTGTSMRFFGPTGWTSFVMDGDVAGESAPSSRAEATDSDEATSAKTDDRNQWADQRLLVIGAAVAAMVVAAILTATTDALGGPILMSAPETPPLIRTIIGAIGATAAIAGRVQSVPGPGWELGPPDTEVGPC